MPLNGTLLGKEMKAAVDRVVPDNATNMTPAEVEQLRIRIFTELGQAIVRHIQVNATVPAIMPGGGVAKIL